MADTAGQIDIRGININRILNSMQEIPYVLKNYVNKSDTTAREVRWFQYTRGTVTPATTTAITTNLMDGLGPRAKPPIAGPTFTRNTSYVKKFMVESETISMEDEKDTDVDIMGRTVYALSRAVGSRVDTHIYNVLTESLSPSLINTTAATADGWDDTVTGDPIKDLTTGRRKIFAEGYESQRLVLYINPVEEENLINFLISVKGSSIPGFSSEQVRSGSVLSLLGHDIVVSNNATTDYALQFIPNVACTWKQFVPMTSAVIDDPGIGKKIRIWEEGIALLTDPKAVHLITDTVT